MCQRYPAPKKNTSISLKKVEILSVKLLFFGLYSDKLNVSQKVKDTKQAVVVLLLQAVVWLSVVSSFQAEEDKKKEKPGGFCCIETERCTSGCPPSEGRFPREFTCKSQK